MLSTEILLEGTMIGAEASVLIESDNSDSSELNKVKSEMEDLVNDNIKTINMYFRYLIGKAKTDIKKVESDDMKKLLKSLISEIDLRIRRFNSDAQAMRNLKNIGKKYVGNSPDIDEGLKYIEAAASGFVIPNEIIDLVSKINIKIRQDNLNIELFKTLDSFKIKDYTESNYKKAIGVFTRIKLKIKELYGRLSGMIDMPTGPQLLGATALLIAVYLVLYGFLKASGAPVKKVHNIITTIKVNFTFYYKTTFAKKVILMILTALIGGLLAVVGTMGWNFIKRYTIEKMITR